LLLKDRRDKISRLSPLILDSIHNLVFNLESRKEPSRCEHERAVLKPLFEGSEGFFCDFGGLDFRTVISRLEKFGTLIIGLYKSQFNFKSSWSFEVSGCLKALLGSNLSLILSCILLFYPKKSCQALYSDKEEKALKRAKNRLKGE